MNQRPDVNPLTARAPRNPFGPQPFSPPAVPGWGGALTQPRPVGPQGPQVQYVPGLMPWSGPRPWSVAPIAAVIPGGQRFNPGAPFAPVIPRGQRFNPGSPVPSPIDPTAILRSVSGPRQSPTGAGIFPGVFEHQRGGVRPDPLRPDRAAPCWLRRSIKRSGWATSPTRVLPVSPTPHEREPPAKAFEEVSLPRNTKLVGRTHGKILG